MKDKGIRWESFKVAKMEKEVRLIDMEFRTEEVDGKEVVHGMAAVYDSWSEDLGGFREMILPGAFDGMENNDIRALFNHDPNKILGRTKSKTLRVAATDKGFAYDYDNGGQTYANDLLISLRRGDVTQSSFSFSVDKGGSEWREAEDGTMERRISKFAKIYDVSPVTFPAYPDTTVAKRDMTSLEQAKADLAEQERQAEAEAREREEYLRMITLKSK